MKGCGELVFGSGGLLGNHLEWVQLWLNRVGWGASVGTARKFGDRPTSVPPIKNKLRALGTLLEQLHWCLVCGPVTEYWMKKSQNMPV
jgi:hypothetical protein